ncbi:MAG TPA: phosphatase, partial [Acidimicrobiales bacterium]|nr:phosphatase [Acidimicrobiales bacterium]
MGSPWSPAEDDDLRLLERLVRNRLCGEVATPVGSCVGNCRRMVEGHAQYTFGLSDWRDATFEDAVAAVEAAGGGRLRGQPDDAPGFIDPAATLAGMRKHRDALADLVAGGGGTVLVATGHPVLLPHYGAVAAALAGAGCRLLQPLGDGQEIVRTP